MVKNTTSPVPPASAELALRHLSYQELDILHCLRGLCAFYVVVYHAKFILWSGGRDYLAAFPRSGWGPSQYLAFALDMLSSAGYEMVIFFFVLSGFFIRYAQQRKPRKPGSFYANRIVRIYPPYLVSAVLAAGGLALVARYAPQLLTASGHREFNTAALAAWTDLRQFDLLTLGRTLVFLPSTQHIFVGYNSVYWSLLPEALFYLVVPLAFWRIRAYYLASGLLYLVGIAIKGSNYEPNAVINFLVLFNFYFAVGAVLYDVVVRTTWLARVRQVPGWLLLAVVSLLSGALLVLAVLKLKLLSGMVAVLLAVVAVSALLAGRVARHNLAVRLFHPVGIFSFSLYLYHFPLLILCSGALTLATGELVHYARYYWLAVPIVTLACYLLYWVTERVSVNYFRKV
jgi:peptidoglycan/LPS O-acetylase OafA/YrhL